MTQLGGVMDEAKDGVCYRAFRTLAWLFRRDHRSAAERIEDRMMAKWIKPNEEDMQAELGDDDEARELIKRHRLYVAFNEHATEERWEVSGRTYDTMTFFCPEYPEPHMTLGNAVRACVAKLPTAPPQ